MTGLFVLLTLYIGYWRPCRNECEDCPRTGRSNPRCSCLSILSRPSRVKGRPHIRDALGSLRLGGEIPSWTPSEPVSEEISCCLATLPSQSLGRYFAVTSEAKRQFSPDRAEILGIPFFSIGKGVCKVSEQWHISFLWNSRFTCFARSS